jgi:hypothetical protein
VALIIHGATMPFVSTGAEPVKELHALQIQRAELIRIFTKREGGLAAASDARGTEHHLAIGAIALQRDASTTSDRNRTDGFCIYTTTAADEIDARTIQQQRRGITEFVLIDLAPEIALTEPRIENTVRHIHAVVETQVATGRRLRVLI